MITEILTPEIDVTWLPWAVSYFFFIGISLAAVLLTLPATLFAKKHLQGVAEVAMIVVLTCAIAGPVALLADLHQPARFWHFYANLTPWSWMSIGAVFLPVYVLSTVIYSSLFLKNSVRNRVREKKQPVSPFLKVMAIVTLVLALIIGLYTGSELAILSSRSLWNSYLLPVFFFITALLGASSLALLLAYFIADDAQTLSSLSRSNRWSAVLSLLVVGAWFGIANMTQGPEASALMQLQDSIQWQQNFMLLVGLLVITAFLSFGISKWNLLPIASGLLVSWFARWMIFMDGQTIPKYDAGFYAYEIPLGTEGLLGIAGIFGLWIFLVIAVYELFPWHNKLESSTK